MSDVHRRLEADRYLRKCGPHRFAQKAARIVGDVNYVHPFREGNGRTQLLWLDQLAEVAGHRLDLTRLTRDAWIPASQASHRDDFAPMTAAIRDAIVESYDQT